MTGERQERWVAALDAYQAHLVRCDEQLPLVADGTLPPTTELLPDWDPPDVRGPLPVDLRDRARDLLAWSRRLEAQITALRDAIGAHLAGRDRTAVRRQGVTDPARTATFEHLA